MTVTEADPVPARTTRSWPIVLFRLVTTAAAVLAFNQAVFAGQFLSGTYAALLLHRDMANYIVGLLIAGIVAAILWRRAGSGPRWPIPATIVLFVLTALQTYLGYALNLAVHIPLGVAVILLLTALTIAAWRRAR